MNPASETGMARCAGKYLTVVLSEEAYGIAVENVREILRLEKVTPVARMPAHIKGVVNLRDRVIPVIDLRVKFGLAAEFTDRTCIVVVHIHVAADRSAPMGLIVDTVEEVVNIPAEEIEPTPEFGAHFDSEHLLGMAKVKGKVTTLLDIEKVIAPAAVASGAGAAGAGEPTP